MRKPTAATAALALLCSPVMAAPAQAGVLSWLFGGPPPAGYCVVTTYGMRFLTHCRH